VSIGLLISRGISSNKRIW